MILTRGERIAAVLRGLGATLAALAFVLLFSGHREACAIFWAVAFGLVWVAQMLEEWARSEFDLTEPFYVAATWYEAPHTHESENTE